MKKTTFYFSSILLATALTSLSYAELQPLENSELSQISAQDGIGLRLEIGLGANPNELVDVAATDPEWSGAGSHNQPLALGGCGETAQGVIYDCTNRIAIEFPKTGTADTVDGGAPFALLLDGFELAMTFEQINLDIEELTDDVGVGTGVGALKVSFPGYVDIGRFKMEKVSLLPTSDGAPNSVDLDANPSGTADSENNYQAPRATPDASDNSLYGYSNNQVNLFGLDIDATFQIDGSIYLFPADLTTIDYGVDAAVNVSATTDINAPVFNANSGFIR